MHFIHGFNNHQSSPWEYHNVYFIIHKSYTTCYRVYLIQENLLQVFLFQLLHRPRNGMLDICVDVLCKIGQETDSKLRMLLEKGPRGYILALEKDCIPLPKSHMEPVIII